MAEAPSFREAMRPILLLAIGSEAVAEVSKAREKHGPNSDLLDGTGPSLSILSDAQIANVTNLAAEVAVKRLNDQGMANDRTHTRFGILLEEVLEAGAANNSKDLRAELVQVMAMAADWIADLDAR
jgi:hypothetical protein